MSAPRRVVGPSPPGRLPAAMLRALTAELSDPGRFSRAKAYARDGAVVDIEIQPGEVRVEVLGSRYEPYQTRVWATPAEDRTSTIGLVPERDELGAECTCPDDAPYAFCKHALTALLVFADEVTIDPDVLVTWRSGTPVARPERDQAAPDSLSALLRAPAEIPEPPRLPRRLPVAMPATADELAEVLADALSVLRG